MRRRNQLVLPDIEPATQLLSTVPAQETPETVAGYLADLPEVRAAVDRRRDPLLWVMAVVVAVLIAAAVTLVVVL